MNRTELKTAIKKYIDALTSMQRSPKTTLKYSTTLNKFYEFLQQDNEEVTPLKIVEWRDYLYKNNMRPNSIRDYLQILKGFFTWCQRMKLVESSPISLEEIPKKKEVEYNLLTSDEIKTLLFTNPKDLIFSRKNFNNKTICRNRAIVVLLLQTGIRNSELRNLKLSDLDFENSIIKIRHGKGDKSRQVPFPTLSQGAINDYLNSNYRPEYLTEQDWLFGCDADEFGHSTSAKIWRQLTIPTLDRMISRYIEKLTGHKKVKVHSLRHAYASLCDDLGVPIAIVSKTLGHSNINITASVYTHVLNRSKAAQEINRIFDENFLTKQTSEGKIKC
jgi:site-specific recombinase XerD